MSGFSGVDIDFFDFPDEKSQLVSVLVATAAGAETNNTSLDDSLAIILEKDSRIQIDLAGSLEAVLKQRSGVVPSLIGVDEVISTDLSKSLCFFLPDLEASFLENLDEKTHKALQQLTHSAKSLFWLNQGGGPSPRNAKADLVTGFARTIRAENPMMKFVTLSFDEIVSPTSAADIAWKIASTCFKKGVGQRRVIYIGSITEANGMNEVIAARSMTQKPLQEPLGAGRPLALSIGVPGLLDTLQFQDDLQCNQAIGLEEVEVEIRATGLNLLDTLVALGQVQGKAFGHEGAGIISKAGNASPFKPGDRVCGLVRGTFNTFARSSHQNWSKIPDNLSFTSAAAIPVVYGTAYYALHDIARIQKGETVLVHWGAGGVGQAAIQLARLAGANLIVTVGSLEKRDFIRDTYGIPEINILASRDLTFAQGVMRLTQGRGVDIVINSMSGQGLRSSWECIAQFGRFVEIGKVDIYSSNSLPMSPFKKNVTFAFIDVGLIAYENGSVFNRVLRDVLQLAHAGKIAEPRPLHLFSYSQIQEAFRIMQTGSHIGKFVLEPHKDDIVPIIPSSKPSYYFKANATYLITGGMGGLGRSMARWMAARGARNLILLSRSGIDHPAARDLLADMDATGVTVAAPKCDVSNKALLQTTLTDCLKVMPPIRGAILGAMTLKDTTYAKMSIQDYQTAVVPKVRGSWNVHDLLPKDLDFFILLSSASGVVGNFGQSNYCVGNTYQDALARHRVAQGLKAASVDLGMILSVGFAAENQDTMAHLRQAGFNAMREGEFLAMLNALCNPNLPPPNPISSQIAIGIEAPEAMRIKGIDEPPWMQDPLFKQLFQIRTGTGSGSDANKDAKKYGVMLSTCTTDEEATNVVTDAIVQKLCKALSTTAREIDIKKPLHAYGVDSLVAVELRTWFAKEIAAEVAVFDIMGGSSLQQLATLAARRSSLVQIASKEESVMDC
ncbi:MAG: putative secondary metabolism biosynthetic enzyme [Bathelium mastoideum]|nr:MAG: putative secondary metabolism biosynthetic enzyme [Bathelium mastoideum]